MRGDRSSASKYFELAREFGAIVVRQHRDLSQGQALEAMSMCEPSDPGSSDDDQGLEGQPTGRPSRPGLFREGRPIEIPTEDWGKAAKVVLDWISLQGPQGVYVVDQAYIPTFGLVSIAACCREQAPVRSELVSDLARPASNFARAIGIEQVISSGEKFVAREQERTVPIARVVHRGQIAEMASRMASLVVPSEDGAPLREVVRYSLVELFRNAVQHSGDPLGGVAAAQMISKEHGPGGVECVQLAIADLGVGIPKTLEVSHPDVLGDPLAALNKAMRPMVSGTFREGQSGSPENAGLGLFFLSQIAKLLNGRFLLASKGAALVATESEDAGHLRQRTLGAEFPGTLAVFEIPRSLPRKFQVEHDVIQYIREKMLPDLGREPGGTWIQMTEPDCEQTVRRILVSVGGDDFSSIRKLNEEAVRPSVVAGTPVCLDFINVKFLTDSMAHELLGGAIQEACKRQIPVFAVNLTPSIAGALVLVQGYLLSDVLPKKRKRRRQRS